MMINGYDWTKFLLRITINKSLPEIYDALTKPEMLQRWLVHQATFRDEDDQERNPQSNTQKKDSYVWAWSREKNDEVEKGDVLEANGTDLVQLSFVGDTVVSMMLKTEE